MILCCRTSPLSSRWVCAQVVYAKKIATCFAGVPSSSEDPSNLDKARPLLCSNVSSILQVMDHDVYSSNDAIGLVYVDLSPLLMRTADGDGESRDLVVQGWFPLYDTLRGVRGALCLVIKVHVVVS